MSQDPSPVSQNPSPVSQDPSPVTEGPGPASRNRGGELDRWVAAAAAELGLEPGDAQTGVVLDLARDVAHQVLRPGAPVTSYLLGVAVGRGADPVEAATRLSALAVSWVSERTDDPPAP